MAPNLEAVTPIVVPAAEPAPIDLAKADALLQVVQTAKSTEAADNLANLVKEHGMQGLKAAELLPKITEILNNKAKNFAPNREGALQFITSVCKIVGAPAEPFLLELLPAMLGALADPVRPVQFAAKDACDAFGNLLNPNMIKQVLPILLETNIKWQVNEGRLKMLNALATRGPRQMARCMPDVITPLTNDMWDLKQEVKAAAKEAMISVCNSIDNRDVVPFIPRLIESMEHPEKVKETVFALASTTFVQTVECAALSIISPLLVRGFAEKETAMKRQCARIVENMTKLVDEPTDVAPFLPKLLPILEAAKEEVSDPECREVCGKAHAILQKKGDTSHTHKAKLNNVDSLLEIVNASLAGMTVDPFYQPALKFICNVALSLYDVKVFDLESWRQTLLPYLLFLGPKAENVVADLLAAVLKDHTPPTEVEEDQDVEELCNCNFSLAYGNKILLNNTNLRLKRGYRYGLVGRNDSGKTSLMRAIANGKVDGFPPPTELRTVFVETDIQGELSDLSVLDYMYADERLRETGVERDEMATVLQSVGFNDQSPANITTAVGALSGGWKMKLALARAMLLKADILLLDEPTNHLDVRNVKWVEDYLNNLKGVTCIMVSHDSGLLDRVCTHIIQIADLKLFLHKGNLSEFVAANPDAKSYFELTSSKQKFSFPQPGPLPGITSKGKAIMKMDGVSFTYPGRDKPTLTNITVRCSLSSRVAVLGVNGAGKSTLIKLLTGELEPQTGDVWKHPNCRFAYVAQHAFHHIENHLDMTPNQYIRWRYEYGNDKEALQKVTVQLTEEEEKKMKQPISVEVTDKDGNDKKLKLVVKRLTEGRREMKKEIEYEVEWENYHDVTWVSQKKLLDAGFEKILKQLDDQIALRATLYARPLTTANVEKHLEDVGLEREFGTHCRMRALSGGQKVKVVLAAAMWNQPHILILDEPTNYLDRDSLGALSGAIREFEGGVVMITHNHQFCTALCPEVWVLEDGRLDLQGDAEWMKQAMNEKIDAKQIEEVTDAFGNVSKVKGPKKELSRAEKKKLDRKKKSNKKNGIAGDDDDDEDW